MIPAKEAASLLGVSISKVYDLFRSGKLTGYRIDRAVRFDPADVEDYKASCRSAGTKETAVGGTNTTVTMKAAGTELADYFQRAGLRPKLTRSTARKAPASSQLHLVSSSRNG